MKSAIIHSLLACFIGSYSLESMSQTSITADRGETVTLKAPGGYSNYLWQVSYDKKNFVNVPEAYDQNLSLKVYAPNFYRVKTVDVNKTIYLDTIQINMTPARYNKEYSRAGASRGFIETKDCKPGGSGISVPHDKYDNMPLTKWTNGDAIVAYYLHNPKDTVDTEMLITIKKNATVAFRISILDPNDLSKPLADNVTSITGTGENQSINFIGFVPPRSDIYRYQLECLEGWENIVEITEYRQHSPSKEKSYKIPQMMGCAVWYNYKSSDPRIQREPYYDWSYQEVMMPADADIPGTYLMCMGMLDGYMGIQMNGINKTTGEPRHDVIFSLWDNANAEEQPDLPDNFRAGVLDHGEGVSAHRFGGEGTGMQSFKRGNNWDCGTYVQFITNCRPETQVWTEIKNGKQITHRQKNSLVSTWYNAQDGKGWQYMATLRLPNKSTYISGWHSFMEDYNHANGQAIRKGYFRNSFGHSKIYNKWCHFNRATYAPHKPGGRKDYGQGASDIEKGSFFMQSGGFIHTILKPDQVPLLESCEAVDTINLKALEERVDQAIQRETARVEASEAFKKVKLDKSLWTLLSYTAEQVASDGKNGHAYQLIDEDPSTFWYSGSKKGPHCFTIDLGEPCDISGMEVAMSGGTSRYMSAFDIYLNDNENEKWELAYSTSNVPNKEEVYHVKLPETKRGRIFRFVVKDSPEGEGLKVRLNELSLSGSPVVTGIDDISSDKKKYDVICSDKEIVVKMNTTVEHLCLSLFKANGGCVYTDQFGKINAGEVIRIPMLKSPKGTYILSSESDKYQHSMQIMWNK